VFNYQNMSEQEKELREYVINSVKAEFYKEQRDNNKFWFGMALTLTAVAVGIAKLIII